MIMRFKEFLITEENSGEYIQRLTKTLNVKRLGSGAYASVFQHPVYHNVAVKFVQEDPAYVEYAWFCKKHPKNKWLPKVVSIHSVKFDEVDWEDGNSDEGTLVFFQKLRKAKPAEIKKAAQEILKDVPDSWFEKNTYERADYKNFYTFDDPEWNVVSKFAKDKDTKELALELEGMGANDIHDANVMMRDEGDRSQLVFTDPVAS